MIRSLSIFLLLLTLLSQCNDRSGAREPVESSTEVVSKVLEKFCPVTHSGSREDFVFVKSTRWDTSFVIVLHKESAKIRGAYHEISPLNDFLSSEKQGLMFFDGFSFELDSVTWTQVINESENLLDTLNAEPETGCMDCGDFILSVGSRVTRNGDKRSRNELENLASYLKRTLVSPILEIKKQYHENGTTE